MRSIQKGDLKSMLDKFRDEIIEHIDLKFDELKGNKTKQEAKTKQEIKNKKDIK